MERQPLSCGAGCQLAAGCQPASRRFYESRPARLTTARRIASGPTELLASLAIFAALLAWQLFLPGFIGIANNGDFAKISGRFCIDSPDRGADNFRFFVSRYVRGPDYCWDSEMPSSELAFAGLASVSSRVAGERSGFDIRWLGAFHAAGLLIAYGIWLRLFRSLTSWRRLFCNLLLILILGDVGYVSYANSFYTDTAALIGAAMMVPAALLVLRDKQISAGRLILFSAAAIIFAASKAQHALLGAAAIAVLLIASKRSHVAASRITAMVCAAAVLGCCAAVIAATPLLYGGQERFDLFFFKLLPGSADRLADAKTLGLREDDVKYSGMHSFMANSPASDQGWLRDFATRTGTGAVIRFYATHPRRALEILRADLEQQAGMRRAGNLSNYRREQGRPPGSLTERFGYWSALRTRLFQWWPWHIVIWYGAVLVGLPLLAWRFKRGLQLNLCWVTVGVALLGVAEFCVASLADSIETYRHLLLFHLFTDFTVLLVTVICVLARAAVEI